MADKKAYVRWDPKFCTLARDMAARGALNQEIAAELGVSPQQFSRWLTRHPDLAIAVKLAKGLPDDRIERSLYQAALGYTIEERVPIKLKNTAIDPQTGKMITNERVEVVTVEKHVPASITACIFWLSNRRSDQWRRTDKPDRDSLPEDLSSLTLSQMQQLLAGYVVRVEN